MGREFELKYRATEAALSAMAAQLGPFRELSMETAYYDAMDGGLSARKWTLRQRLENGVSVCTLKIPLGDGSRGEWETECGDLMSAIPELCKLGAPDALLALTRGGIRQVCGAKFTRLAALIPLEDAAVELALDQGELLGGGKSIPLCEAEVELKAGSDAVATAFARLLAARYGLEPEQQSKFKRALALAKSEK